MINNKDIKPNQIKPKNKGVLLILPRVTASGIFVANTQDKDTSSNHWYQIYKVGKDCTENKVGDWVLANFANRPLMFYDKDVYEWDEEFDLVQMYEHDLIADLDLTAE